MSRSGSEASVQDSDMGDEQPEICPRCKVKVPVDPDYVMIWLEQAEVDAKEAKRNKSQTHALYWVQQSVEKLVKARMLANGWCYCEVVGVRHESLKGFLEVISVRLQDPQVRDMVDRMAEADSLQRLEGVQTLVDDEEMRSGMAILGPGELRMLLDGVSDFESEREKLRSQAFSSGNFESGSKVNKWFCRSIPFRNRCRVTGSEEIFAHIFYEFGICDHQLTELRASMDDKRTKDWLRWAEADPRLYVLASVTFPHATSTRYPAHPNAPDDLQEAAGFSVADRGKAKRMGAIGTQHYSNRIGVIYYVRRLADEAETTAKLMQEWWQSLNSRDIEQLSPCTQCESIACRKP